MRSFRHMDLHRFRPRIVGRNFEADGKTEWQLRAGSMARDPASAPFSRPQIQSRIQGVIHNR
jgi:hypothetical protein